jgi:ABC-type sugar transport system substrate-binding protein
VLAKAVGMKTKIFANDGQTTQHNTAIEEAIHQHYDAIDLECDYDPTTTAPAIAQARKAGVKVIAYGATEQETKDSKIDADTVDPYALDARIAADQAVVQHDSKAFHAIAITSNEAPATSIMQNSLKAELGKICPKCTVTEVNVPVAKWSTDVASSVTSALLRNKDVTVLFPDYAGLLTYLLKGLQAAHRSDIKAYLAFGGGTPFIKLQTTGPGKSIIQSDIGGYPPWTGYLLFLQTARVLTGMTPIPIDKAIGPNRVATPDNAVEVLTTGGWGKDWVNGFRALLGLPALSGAALTNASTLNGAMTAKPGT